MNILLTGASRGIGAAALAALEASGHRVAGHSTRGGSGLIDADLADPAAPRRLWEQAVHALGGRIDVLVNNAGVYEAVGDDASDDEWHAAWSRTMTVNLQASSDLSRLAVQHFRTIGGGRIVNVASRAGYRGDSPQHWHYAASKAAMIAVTKTVARGYAAENILAFAVCPGFTVTEMTEGYLATRGGEKILAEIPLGRVASAAEIGEIIRWLASGAPASATGTIVDANGASYVR
ncbi:MAG: 3-oxoacyl-[acyl-carrier protein] reductase [uncultured Sphingomonas sp.]|uniref:3-oxoacyl-[acyl-carrier protein] reductase n=1 Tax=uncultured Sphingomonas sp. TaxID=158754 RepID=A0A6J4SWP8_9SPHN|nr:SDR family oxidoreductase [uncultured Sphingomonas sp.]CAA9507218.1 MAG: 3-oxoacyl-[acyl-carrier protein] reductase [uncultured Sphingomonas sp.]